MNPRFYFLAGVALVAATTGAFAEASATNTSPGPVTVVDLTNAPPATPALNAGNVTALSGGPVTKAPNTKNTKAPNPNATPATAKALAGAPAKGSVKAAASVLDNYLNDLTDTLKLSAEEKKDIQTYYLADGLTLKNILNNNSLSPLQQAQQVADLRDKRDAKIDALLDDPALRHDFHRVEARYRVALTEFAANGGLAPAPPLPNTPGQTAPVPATKTGAE